MYPLNCLENESKLSEQMLLNRNSSVLNLVDDSVWQAYLSSGESKIWLQKQPEELRDKAEWLLRFECALLRERSKV
jgi:hypothetical protein